MTKKATGSKIVKLVTYVHDHEEILVDTFKATDWKDFVIVAIDVNNLTPDRFTEIQDSFSRYAEQMKKRIIIVPRDLNIEFYGVTPDD